jgi:predicted amidohydrolase
MKVALVVHRVLPDVDANLATIVDMAQRAADDGADLVLFSEAALTGLINNDHPAHDLPLGCAIPGPVTGVLGRLARQRRLWLAIGLLEREGNQLYDSALLLTPGGEIGLKYRRIQPQWHGKGADPTVYCQGTALPRLETPLGTFAFLICGDLFDDGIVRRVRDLRPDWLLFPFARCFSSRPGDQGRSSDQKRWDREEKPAYAQRVALAGVTTLMTNYLADRTLLGGTFGGAMVVAADGTVIDALPLGRAGMLVVDLAGSRSARNPVNPVENGHLLVHNEAG